MIDKSKIKVGDWVKIEVHGLISPDWTVVTEKPYGIYGRIDRMVGEHFLNIGSVIVTDHQPGFAEQENLVKRLEKELAKARDELKKSRDELNKDKNTFKVGDKVYYKHLSGKVHGVVTDAPEYSNHWANSHEIVWAHWEDNPVPRYMPKNWVHPA